MEDYLRKMQEIILETLPKQGNEKWLLIIGRREGEKKERAWYTGFEWVDNDWSKIDEHELSRR